MNYDVKSLWAKGRYQEIFGFESNNFTALDLTSRYADLIKRLNNDSEEKRIFDNCFEIFYPSPITYDPKPEVNLTS